MTLRLYLDEYVVGGLATMLQSGGLDVVDCRHLGNVAISDDRQLEIAAADGRAILSCNYRDFLERAPGSPPRR